MGDEFLNINVICVGRLKEQYWREACAEYLKRLGGFGRANVIELSESRLPQEPSLQEIKAALSEEAKLMQPYLNDRKALQIAMCIEGRQLSSEELSKKLSEAGVSGFSAANFYIGSSFGLSDEVKSACGIKLSISKMTLPHQLCRVVLLEQIYRALSISAGTKYHK